MRVSAWDSPQDEEDKDMPPLEEQSGSDSQEDSQEDSEADTEDNEADTEDSESDAPTPIIPRSRAYLPPMIPLLTLFLFFLHLFQYGQLLQEKRLREKNPCFLMPF